jgi:hypothetical protein
MTLNLYWHMPKWAQRAIDKLTPKLNSWDLTIRLDESGVWTFSKLMIVRESLCGGTEVVISEIVEKLTNKTPHPGDRVRMHVTSQEPENYTTYIDWVGADDLFPGSNYYVEPVITNKSVWLCPVLGVMFPGEAPKRLWLTFTPCT